jgi:endonuclease/exonuclease/phosphatase family metal-dependent hydrolase
MRQIIDTSVPQIEAPSLADRLAAAQGPSTRAVHDGWMEAWPALSTIECMEAPIAAEAAVSLPRPVRVVAWNIERCKHVEASAGTLRAEMADIVLATEMDNGCARTHQRHTTADLARELGFAYVYGVEFVELGLGDPRESAEHAQESNLRGLHGNAVLSRWPIVHAALIPLDDGGAWYVSDLKQGQRRVGGRNAIAAIVATPAGELAVAAVHFESVSTPQTRAVEARRLIEGFAPIAGARPALIGGDFNVKELSLSGLDEIDILDAPDRIEPAFAVFSQAGYAWDEANLPGITTQKHPHDDPAKPDTKIDWFFSRGVTVRDATIGSSLGPDGTVLSDHRPIAVTLVIGPT